jgi:hypothetical protein
MVVDVSILSPIVQMCNHVAQLYKPELGDKFEYIERKCWSIE